MANPDEESCRQVLLDWLATDDVIQSAAPVPYLPKDLDQLTDAGLTAWVTPAGSDAGIDGAPKDGERVILVQCKRYAPEHPVGRPAIQQFKGVIEENFCTREAMKAAAFEYIEVFYNRKRLHSTLGYTSPVQFLRDWADAQQEEKQVA